MIPLQTDRPLRRTPYVNIALIAASTVMFVSVRLGSESWIEFANLNFVLWPPYPDAPHAWWQFLTYQFMHADWMHLIGNMLFLWVFGNAVEDRFGHVGYAAFYLIGGVAAGFGHVAVSMSPVLGASGAVAAVTGAFLALFPKTNVRILWLFFIITIFEIPSMWFIGFAIARDVFSQIMPGDKSVAYMAHLAGYGYGLLVGLILLWTHLLSREPYDLFTLIKHWNRRRQFKAVTRQGFDPWSGRRPGKTSAFADEERQPSKRRKSGGTASSTDERPSDPSADPRHEQPPPQFDVRPAGETEKRRHAVHAALAAGDAARAAEECRALWRHAPDAVLGESDLLAVSNQFFAESDYESAAKGYRQLLGTYPTGDPRGQIRLMLGMTLARYLNQHDEARQVITSALERVPAGPDRDFALQIQNEVGGPATPAEDDADAPSRSAEDVKRDHGDETNPIDPSDSASRDA